MTAIADHPDPDVAARRRVLESMNRIDGEAWLAAGCPEPAWKTRRKSGRVLFTADTVEEIEFLLSCGESAPAVARAVGFTVDTITRDCRKIGRHDLSMKFDPYRMDSA